MNGAKLQTLALQGGRAFLSTAPKLVGGAFFGIIGGVFTGAFVGALLAGASLLLWRGSTLPAWMNASLALTPVVLALAGGYVGFVRGVLSALAKQVVEKKLIAWVYAQVKPAAVNALAKVGSSDAVKLAAAVRDEIGAVFAKEEAEAPKPESFADKVAHFITLRSRRMLALSVVSHLARARTGAEAAEEIEKLGIEKLELIVVSSLEDLFSMKLNLVSGAALLVCIAPQLVWWLTKT
ncbi:MAG: hypothetical protein QM817_29345 [Archangium sp.]